MNQYEVIRIWKTKTCQQDPNADNIKKKESEATSYKACDMKGYTRGYRVTGWQRERSILNCLQLTFAQSLAAAGCGIPHDRTSSIAKATCANDGVDPILLLFQSSPAHQGLTLRRTACLCVFVTSKSNVKIELP